MADGCDLVSILIAVRKSRSLTELKETQGRLLQEQKEVKQKLGGKIYHAVWKRLNRAYPEMEALEEADRQNDMSLQEASVWIS